MSKLCRDCACENVCAITHTPNDIACDVYYKPDAVTELEKIETKIIRNSRPQWEKLVIDVATCQLLIKERIEELKGENHV